MRGGGVKTDTNFLSGADQKVLKKMQNLVKTVEEDEMLDAILCRVELFKLSL